MLKFIQSPLYDPHNIPKIIKSFIDLKRHKFLRLLETCRQEGFIGDYEIIIDEPVLKHNITRRFIVKTKLEFPEYQPDVEDFCYDQWGDTIFIYFFKSRGEVVFYIK